MIIIFFKKIKGLTLVIAIFILNNPCPISKMDQANYTEGYYLPVRR